jgi:hypothetical protein
MPNVEKWYLTQEGWLRSSSEKLATMEKGLDIFQIIQAGRNGFCDTSRVVWDCCGCDLEAEVMERQLVRKFGERPGDLQAWFSEYSGARL